LVNRLSQPVFKVQPFDAAGFNLHIRPGEGSRQLVVLVHGFGGRGYATWGHVPERLFGGAEGLPVDVGVYDYRSAHRRLCGGTPELSFWSRQLRDHLRDIEGAYSNIFLVGHSLGGVLIEAVAKEYLQARAMEGGGSTMPLAALVLVAAPRAGSGWAAPVLEPLIREIRAMRRLTLRSAEVDEFFSSYVERHNIAAAPPGRTVLPMYAVVGGRDRLVSEFSAAFSIPERQKLRLTANHFSIVKPQAHDVELISWLHRIIVERLEVRDQAAREQQHSAHRSRTLVGPARPEVVTQFSSDPTGLQWEELYNEVRRAATTVAVAVHDAREVPTADVDLLIVVHDAQLVLASSPAVRATVIEACAERDRRPSLSVGISPVGSEFRAAETTVRGWVAEEAPGPSVYVTGAADATALRGVLARWLQLVIRRDPRRGTDALANFGLSGGNDPHGYPGNGSYL
jgi:pimeloyl-ACP methyl ester carboxylesterase